MASQFIGVDVALTFLVLNRNEVLDAISKSPYQSLLFSDGYLLSTKIAGVTVYVGKKVISITLLLDTIDV